VVEVMGLKQTRVSLVISWLKYVEIKINYFRCSAVINLCVEITICMHVAMSVVIIKEVRMQLG
jgi:uncharacterized protein YbcI